jgi:hypothetical protein
VLLNVLLEILFQLQQSLLQEPQLIITMEVHSDLLMDSPLTHLQLHPLDMPPIPKLLVLYLVPLQLLFVLITILFLSELLHVQLENSSMELQLWHPAHFIPHTL